MESTTCFMAPGLTLPGSGEEIAPLQVRFEERTKKIFASEDIFTDGKLDVLEIIDFVSFEYKNVSNKIVESQTEYFDLTNMTEMRMMIKTRPRYPSNTLTLSIANITNHKNIRFFNIWLQLNIFG